MAQRTTFDKLQRDRAKKAKQAAKRERRQEKASETGEDVDIALPEGEEALTAAELMQQVEAITRRLDAGTISLEDFEEAKAELMLRLPIE
jgi:seryl-tRNA synthetase